MLILFKTRKFNFEHYSSSSDQKLSLDDHAMTTLYKMAALVLLLFFFLLVTEAVI